MNYFFMIHLLPCFTYRRKKLKAKLKFVSFLERYSPDAVRFFFPHGNFITLQSADWLFYLGSQRIKENLPGASKVASFRFWCFHIPRKKQINTFTVRFFQRKNRNHAITNFYSLCFLSLLHSRSLCRHTTRTTQRRQLRSVSYAVIWHLKQ